MLIRSPKLLAAVACAAGMMFATLSTAQAQRPTYRNISHRTASHGHGYGHDCPCPCPEEGVAADPDQVPTPSPEGGEDLPEIADLSGDTSFASAPQSAVPNAIGDSMGGCFTFVESFPTNVASACPGGGRTFRISENNSALPQHRVYYNYHYFNNAIRVGDANDSPRIDIQRHELGFEVPFWCNMASFGLEVPFSHTVDSTRDFGAGGSLRDVEFGNVSLYLKTVLYQDCCKTVSAGLGIDLPTADDIEIIDLAGDDFSLDNDVVTLAPYIAFLRADACSNMFMHGFVQFVLPTDDYDIVADGDADQLDGGTYLFVDASIGYWLRQDCCGGVAAIAELHYAENIEGGDIASPGGEEVRSSDFESLNATAGLHFANGCWSVRPAVVLPLLDRPNRAFDWEFALQVNRRF